MRVEAHSVGSLLHVVQRGTRGTLIAPSDFEKKRFLRTLFYLNAVDTYADWGRDTAALDMFEWPGSWKERIPIVEVLAWTLMPNHFHLILREIQEGGIAKFMQRLCGSMTTSFNSRYGERGSLFQGGYKGRVISDTADARYVATYVMGKNVMELYHGGVSEAVGNFSSAWQFALEYEFSSLMFYAKEKASPILPSEQNILKEILEDPDKFKKSVEDMIYAWYEKKTHSDFES